MNDTAANSLVVTVLLVLLLALVGVGAWGCPKYNIWRLEMRGRADLAEAQWNRQIQVQEAEAERDASVLLAQRDSIEALGVAAANRILGESLKNNEAYLRYVWIQALKDSTNQVIYVPTEANLPILEATRIR